MSTIPPRWQPMTAALPVLSTIKNLPADFFDAGANTIALRLRGKLPDGQWILVAASRPHHHYWYQALQVEGNTFTASSDGFDAAWAACGDCLWSLSLGRLTGNGVFLYPLKNYGDTRYFRTLNTCFCDDRRRFFSPAGEFSRENINFLLVPRYERALYSLSLQIVPASARYANQLACRLSACSVTGERLEVAVRCPDTMEQPEGFTLSDSGNEQPPDLFFSGEADGDFSVTHTVRGTVPLRVLAGRSGQFELSCVFRREGERLLACPMRLADPQLAAELQSREFQPLSVGAESFCYLSVDFDHHLVLNVSPEDPGVQYPDCTSLSEFLDTSPQEQYSLTVQPLESDNWQWRLRLPGLDLTGADELLLCLRRDNAAWNLRCPVTEVRAEGAGCVLTADLSQLPEHLENCLPATWLVTLAVRRGTRFWYLPLLDPVHTLYDSKTLPTTFSLDSDLTRTPIGSAQFAGRPVEACQHWGRKFNGRLCLRTADQCLRYGPSFLCRASTAQLRFGRLRLVIRCPKVDGEWIGIMLTHRYKLEEDRRDYYFPCKRIIDRGDCFELHASINVHRLEFLPLYWDICAVFRRGQQQFWSMVKAPARAPNPAGRLKESALHGLLFGETAHLRHQQQLFLYRTVGNRFALVCQERTPYSGLLFRLKERLAFGLYLLTRKRLRRESILLVYEKYCCMAQDNGFYFFRHCMEHDVEKQLNRKIYFVIDKHAPDYQKNLLPYRDHVIQFMSLKHMVYLLAARLLVSSDSKAHAYAWRCKESILQPFIEHNRKLVFLQHGVIALKKVEFFRSGTNTVDLFITSNRMERDIIINELGYQPQEVIITGLTRWDVLQDRSASLPRRAILVMPTWRNWLEEVSDHAFRASDYYQNYMQLLNSPRLAEFLERYDLDLNFYIHPKFREYLDNFDSPGGRVRLIPFGSEPLNRLIMECSLLITDYSSVCWDVYYQAKPVIFYQFDVEKYNEAQGAYIDLEKDLFGDRAVNNEQLFACLEDAAQNGFQLKEPYASMREQMYEYIDNNNSQRVCDEIRRRNW